jgi:hypothetical protein
LGFSFLDTTRLGGFFDGGSPMVFFGLLGSFTGDFLGDGGSLLSAGFFDFLVLIRIDLLY